MLLSRALCRAQPYSVFRSHDSRRKLCVRSGKSGELSWDPEGLLGRSGTGHIARRQMEKRMETDKEFAVKVEQAKGDMQKEAIARREGRVEPTDLEGFVEYFLNTDMEDMQYEVTRYRPRLSKEFFALLDQSIGSERFAADPNEEKIAELESLRSFLEEAVKVIDNTVNESASVAERFRKLLVSKDKKATILEMVAANEIDSMFIDFIEQNIQDAKDSNEVEKADFMEKLKNACKRYA